MDMTNKSSMPRIMLEVYGDVESKVDALILCMNKMSCFAIRRVDPTIELIINNRGNILLLGKLNLTNVVFNRKKSKGLSTTSKSMSYLLGDQISIRSYSQ